MTTDAAERKRLETALEESRRMQATLLGNLPGMVYRCRNDRNWTMLFVSSGCMNLTGYSATDLIGNNRVSYGDLVLSDDAAAVWNGVQEGLRKKERFRLIYRIRTAEGATKWVWEQGIGVFDAHGALVALEGFITDISEQQLAHESLQSAHRDLERHVQERTGELTAANESLRHALRDRDRLDWLLRAIVDHVPIMLFLKDAETLVVELWNNAAAMLSGVPASDIVGKTGYEVFPKEQMEAFHQRDRAVIRYRKLIEAEELLTTRHGERLIYTRKIPIIDERGDARYLLGISEDITDRKRALAEVEERTKLSMLAADVGAVITTGCNQEKLLADCCRIIVQRLDAVLGRIWTLEDGADAFLLKASAGATPDVGGAAARIRLDQGVFSAVVQTRQPFYTSAPFQNATAENYAWDLPGIFGSFAAFPLIVDQRLLGILAVYTNHCFSKGMLSALTALVDNMASGIQARRSEAALRQSLERFDHMVEGAKVGLWDAMVVAADPYNPSNPIYYSPRLKEMLGYSANEFPDTIGSWAERLYPADRDRVFQALDDHLFRRVPYDIEYRMVLRSGEIRWFNARGQAQWDAVGTPVRLSGSLSDITDRKESERLLQEAREAAEAANRAKSRFLANISHEIRTPISAMLTATELLAQTDATDRRHRADLILRNTRHLMSLIDDLLDFSRVEAGKLEVARVPCALMEVLADIRAVTLPLSNKPQVEYRIEIASDLPETIVTDPTRLRQAVINLVNNALKFTEFGWVLLRISADPEAPDPRLTFEVRDSGMGIASDELVRVFQPFERVSQPGDRVESGVGLGLTISQWIARQLGGDLSVRSELGEGSTFTLRIATGPLVATPWFPPEHWMTSRAVAETHLPRFSSRQLRGTVLIAEDYADTLEVFTFALTSAGAKVTTVDNGVDAVAQALAHPFDLILMDIRMPRLDGLSAAIELRARGCLAPIVAFTASTASSDRERIIKAGFDDLWTKPISLERFIQSVSAYLQDDPPDPGAAPTMSGTPPTLRTKLDRLADQFIAGLPQRMNVIRDLVIRQQLGEAVDRIHQLIGTAGVHGFDAVCEAAAGLQRRFRETHVLEVEHLALLEQAVTAISSTGKPEES